MGARRKATQKNTIQKGLSFFTQGNKLREQVCFIKEK